MAKVNEVNNAIFNSVFKNTSGRILRVPFARPYGRTVKVGEVFEIEGDPRSETFFGDEWPNPVKIIKTMIERGDLQYISSPSPVVDDKATDVSSSIKASGAAVTTTPVSIPAEPERVLPTITPVVSYAADEFSIDWSGTAGLSPNDRFSVAVTLPDGTASVLHAGGDAIVSYPAEVGSGTYGFQVTVTAENGKKQDGVVVELAAA